jgi:hypothetical protein
MSNKNLYSTYSIIFDVDFKEQTPLTNDKEPKIMSDAPYLRLYKDFTNNNDIQTFYLVDNTNFWHSNQVSPAFSGFQESLEHKILNSKNYKSSFFK